MKNDKYPTAPFGLRVTRVSLLSGKTHSRFLPIRSEQLERWRNGVTVQDAFPQLSADEREFLLTGITPEEWDAAFGEE
jgi:hypothetical protein